MQKNKFVHEDIKAVCNSAAKKLVALGLVCLSSITSTPNSTFAGNCHSGKGQSAQKSAQPATRNAPEGTRFLVAAGRNLALPSNPENLIIVYPGDRLVTGNGGIFEIENRYINWTVTAWTNRIEYNRPNTETRNQNAGSSFMDAIFRDFSFTPQQQSDFMISYNPYNKN